MGILFIVGGFVALVIFRVILTLIVENPRAFVFFLSRLALVVMCCSITWAGWEWYKLRQRNAAYQAVRSEVKKNTPNFDVIADNVETFINYPPRLSSDQRDRELKQIYQEEYAKWFVQNPVIPDEVMEHRTTFLKTGMNSF